MNDFDKERIAQIEKLGLKPDIITREFADEVFAKGTVVKDGIHYDACENGLIQCWDENRAITSMFDLPGFCFIED